MAQHPCIGVAVHLQPAQSMFWPPKEFSHPLTAYPRLSFTSSISCLTQSSSFNIRFDCSVSSFMRHCESIYQNVRHQIDCVFTTAPWRHFQSRTELNKIDDSRRSEDCRTVGVLECAKSSDVFVKKTPRCLPHEDPDRQRRRNEKRVVRHIEIHHREGMT